MIQRGTKFLMVNRVSKDQVEPMILNVSSIATVERKVGNDQVTSLVGVEGLENCIEIDMPFEEMAQLLTGVKKVVAPADSKFKERQFLEKTLGYSVSTMRVVSVRKALNLFVVEVENPYGTDIPQRSYVRVAGRPASGKVVGMNAGMLEVAVSCGTRVKDLSQWLVGGCTIEVYVKGES